VTLIDANILLYAYDAGSSQHTAAREWVESALTEEDEIALSWLTIIAFLRIGTSKHALGSPLTVNEATDIMAAILSRSNVRTLSPGPAHWDIYRRLLIGSQATGNLATDAHLAALALEHNCMLATNDKDFTRFSGLKIVNPIAKQ
jgi:toxin-antitoxin system PIN domain toxin